jgi:hypothetical protein
MNLFHGFEAAARAYENRGPDEPTAFEEFRDGYFLELGDPDSMMAELADNKTLRFLVADLITWSLAHSSNLGRAAEIARYANLIAGEAHLTARDKWREQCPPREDDADDMDAAA